MALKKLKIKKLKPKKQPELPAVPPEPEPEPEPQSDATDSEEPTTSIPSTPLRKLKLRKLKKKGMPKSGVADILLTETSPEFDSPSEVSREIVTEEADELSTLTVERTFKGIPEADWRTVTAEEVRGMSIPELHGLHLDENQRYLLVRMLASSKPTTLQGMHNILLDANPTLSYAERHYRVNSLRVEGTIRLLTYRVAGEYLFEVRPL